MSSLKADPIFGTLWDLGTWDCSKGSEFSASMRKKKKARLKLLSNPVTETQEVGK